MKNDVCTILVTVATDILLRTVKMVPHLFSHVAVQALRTPIHDSFPLCVFLSRYAFTELDHCHAVK